MGRFVVVYATLLVILLLIVRNVRKKEGIKLLKKEVKDINAQYRSIFLQRPVFGMLMQTGLLLLTQFFVAINLVAGVIGYGDIVPVTMAARIMSIIISTTSVICLTVFLSSVLSYRDNEG